MCEKVTDSREKGNRNDRIFTDENGKTTSPEDLLEAVCFFYSDKFPGQGKMVAGLRLGFLLANPDEGWKHVAPAWLADLRKWTPLKDPQQQQMIREAMKAIAERKPGRTKLVYDKTRRTIVAVASDTMTASPEERLEAVCQFYSNSKECSSDVFVRGMRLGFLIADPDEGWKQVAPIWITEYFESLKKSESEIARAKWVSENPPPFSEDGL